MGNRCRVTVHLRLQMILTDITQLKIIMRLIIDLIIY